MEKMKERVVTFGDAVIAIIITVIVLSLPIKLSESGELDLYLFFRSTGIYFISFCFVANLWYQGAQIFSRIKRIKNKDFVLYMLFLFFLSLMPTFTRLPIEDTNRQIVFLYGLLNFIVTFFWGRLVYSFNKQLQDSQQETNYFSKQEHRRHFFLLLFRLAVLVIAYFFPTAGLFIYLVLPILGFLQNIVDREEDHYLAQMNEEQRGFYRQSWKDLKGSRVKNYLSLLQSSLNDSGGTKDNSGWWHNFNQQWQKNFNNRLQILEEKLAETDDFDLKTRLEAEKQALLIEKAEFDKIEQLAKQKKNDQNKNAETKNKSESEQD